MKYEELLNLLQRVCEWLIQPKPTIPTVPQDASWGIPTEEEERWAAEWIETFLGEPDFEKPLSPRQRYVLLPRFRYAAFEIHVGLPALRQDRVRDLQKKLEELIVTRWVEVNRKRWLEEPHNPETDEQSLEG